MNVVTACCCGLSQAMAEQIVLVWVGAVPDGTSRPRSETHRDRECLPLSPWFLEKFASILPAHVNKNQFFYSLVGKRRVHPNDHYGLEEVGSGALPLVGLVAMKPGKVFDRATVEPTGVGGLPSTPSLQEQLLLELYRSPRDAYSAVIVDEFALDDPLPIYFKLSSLENTDSLQRLSKTQALFLPGWDLDVDLRRFLRLPGCRSLLQKAGVELASAELQLRQTCVLPLPLPIVMMIFAKHWSDVILLTRWHVHLGKLGITRCIPGTAGRGRARHSWGGLFKESVGPHGDRGILVLQEIANKP